MFKYFKSCTKWYFKINSSPLIFKKLYSIKLSGDRNSSAYKRIGIGGFALLTVPALTFYLGTWQVQRRNWKLKLVADLENRTNAPPVDLPEDLEEVDELEYRKVKVRGAFVHSGEIYLHPKTLLQKGAHRGGSLMSSGQVGVHVITPFYIPDRDLTILVNRGWVPKKKTDPRTRPSGQVENEIEVVGLVRRTEKRAPFMPKNEDYGQFWYSRDIESMAERCQTSPVFLDAVEDSQVQGGPIGGQTQVSLRNEHMSYIITWYSLSAATLYMWYTKFIRPFRP